mgnify:CR=1 FL=1
MLITVQDLEKYSGVRGDALASNYVTSAIEIVRNYLGYNPEQTEYDELYDGTGMDVVFLDCPHITELLEVEIGGESVPVDNFYVKENALYYKGGTFPLQMQYVRVHYVGGWPEEAMPESIKGTALQIASLRQVESGQNIGVSSKSFGNEGTRVFLSTRKYNDLLFNISAYKLI